MTQRGWRRFVPWTLLTGAGWLLTTQGCSQLNTTAVQCLSEAECLAKGPAFANTTCDATTKTCVPLQAGAGLCATNADCAATGSFTICRKSDKKCVALQSPECPTVMDKKGDYKNDHVIILGAITPANDSDLGAMMEKAVNLAQQDFSAFPLPPVTGSTDTRPIIFVGCNEFGAGTDGLVRAGKHLVQDLQVPVVIGPVDSGNVLQIALQVSLPNKTLDIFPTTTLSAVSSLPNPASTPLLWRLSYSDAALAASVAAFMAGPGPTRVVDLGIAASGDPLKVMLIEEGNIYGLTIGGKIQKQLQFNGKSADANAQDMPPHYVVGNVGDQRDPIDNPTPDATVAKVVAAALAYQPHVIIHASAIIGITKVLIPLEAQWPMGTPRPLHVAANPSWQSSPLTSWIAGQKSRAQRIFVMRGKPPPPNSTSDWDARFKGAFQEFASVPSLSPLLYLLFDAAYMAAYATAAVGSAPLTGENAALGMKKLSVMGSPDVNAVPTDIGKAQGILAAGETIKYIGLSGPLNLDPMTGAPIADADVACPDLTGHYVPSGFTWSATTMQGSGGVTNCQ